MAPKSVAPKAKTKVGLMIEGFEAESHDSHPISKSLKCAVENVEESTDEIPERELDHNDSDEEEIPLLSPRKSRRKRKKTRKAAAESGSEERAGPSKRKGKGKQQEVLEEESEVLPEPEVVDNPEESGNKQEEEVSFILDGRNLAHHVVWLIC
jgi:hypothetical protein